MRNMNSSITPQKLVYHISSISKVERKSALYITLFCSSDTARPTHIDTLPSHNVHCVVCYETSKCDTNICGNVCSKVSDF